MHTLPSIPYSGLTIILDEPSRHDVKFSRLCSGPVRDYLNQDCLPERFSLDSCDLRDLTVSVPLLPDTKYVILAGEKAAKRYSQGDTDPPGYSAPAIIHNTPYPALPIFYPQDTCDFKNLRGVDNIDEIASDRDTKESIPTQRKNHRFWNTWHIKKFLSRSTPVYPPISFKIFPPLEQAITILDNTTNEEIFLDIETSRLHRSLACIGFSTSSTFPAVFVVPIYLTSGGAAYRDLYKFHRSLSLSLSRNTVVAHNSMFDVTVLHGFYKICLPRSIYDTMLAQARCFPEAEKSLAHTISAWTDMPNHKNFNTQIYDRRGEENLWRYNAFDVYNLKLIKDAQTAYAASVPGLPESIEQINESIIPYIATSLSGMPIDQIELALTHQKLSRYQTLYGKIASILVGQTFNPSSTKQCADYLHKKLHYPIVSKTSTGAPALGSQQIYQLMLKYPNPLLPVILKYREVAKDASSLESELFTLP